MSFFINTTFLYFHGRNNFPIQYPAQLKLMDCPRKISKKAAYKIIDTQIPRGIFYLIEGDIYVGIDNRTGDVWTEEFHTMKQCRKWLAKERDEV